ncbi:vacuolar protein sorting-associated protein 25 [Tanacetum coccineum]
MIVRLDLDRFCTYNEYSLRLQPVRETREKQIQLWKELILDYCRTQKIFVIGLEQDFPLFSNPAIERSLNHEAREAFLSALVSDGRAEWMDKNRRQCLILWHRIKDWADLILNFVKENGLEDSVMTVDEIRTGIESRGTDIHGMDRTVLLRALKLLENKGKLAIFKGTSADDEGVNYLLCLGGGYFDADLNGPKFYALKLTKATSLRPDLESTSCKANITSS